MEEPSVLQPSSIEGSRTTLDETLMPPPSRQRGLKRKSNDLETTLPVSLHARFVLFIYLFILVILFPFGPMIWPAYIAHDQSFEMLCAGAFV